MIAKYTMLQKTISPTEFVYSRTSGGFNLAAMPLLFLILLCTSGFFFVEACFGAHFSVCFSSTQQIVPTAVPAVKYLVLLLVLDVYFLRLCSYFLFRILKPGINKMHSVTLTFSGSIRHAILALSVCVYLRDDCWCLYKCVLP